ncbi:MAG: MFS transporter [Burkholderiales bacterium]|nr:MFS transporter [Burkholderiales bacterium]MDG2202992.1 MFS transporter [Burkholderiales bacterium]|tara:strand:+ start:103 stop:1293 length:1191 start_codon:yes stop_codon:yes gene_type:complete
MPSFTQTERRASFGLASVFSLRMFGLFVILPVVALYADALPGGNSAILIGLAVGIYGLTQAIFQIPLGRLSDFWGRKKTIYLGLSVFVLGSFVAAAADSLAWLCVGRAIQGAGAVSSTVIALNADLTREEVRTKSMAIIGITIGFTFILSIVLGPVLESIVGLPGIFLITAALTFLSMGVVYFYVPDPFPDLDIDSGGRKSQSAPVSMAAILSNTNLLRLDFGIFSLHGILMSMFVSLPFILRNLEGSFLSWQFYLVVMTASILIMLPLMMISERLGHRKVIFLFSIMLIAGSQTILGFFELGYVGLSVALIIFFGAFNLLEASLPSWISRVVDQNSKGSALGVYSTSQYLGTFIGGVLGGWIYQYNSGQGVFIFCAAWALLWLITAFGLSDSKNK